MLKKREEEHTARASTGAASGLAPVIVSRPARERFHTQIDWLDSRHTFSFGRHYDPRWRGFRDLLVINDDRVAPAQGFGRHPHDDMEIISYVLEGALEHKDSMGNGSVMAPGDVQYMCAGTGVVHGEWNPSKTEPVHFLQIWILPERDGFEPSYQQTRFAPEEKRGKLRPIVSRDGREGSLPIHQDTVIFATMLEEGERVEHRLEPGRHAWVHVVRGGLRVNGEVMKEGDGAALGPGGTIALEGAGGGEALLFDLR